jgi:hypothetical protein
MQEITYMWQENRVEKSEYTFMQHEIEVGKPDEERRTEVRIGTIMIWIYRMVSINNLRSQWPLGLRRRSAAARLLGSWVWNPPGAWMFAFVSVVCCQVEFSATSWSLVQRSPTDCGASLCVI